MQKKRGNNEGSIHRRNKDGRFGASVTIQGRRIQKTFKTEKEAKAWLKPLLHQMESGLSYKGANYSLGEYLDEWLESKKSTLKFRTHGQYEQVARQHIKPYLGKVKLKDLEAFQIQRFYNEKLRNGSSENTVYLIHRVLRGAIRQAYLMNLILRNPIAPVKSPKPRKKEMKTLSDYQVRELLKVAEGTELETLLFVEIATGLRMGEIIGLKWSDLDMAAGTLRVCRQVQREKGRGLVYSEPKSEKSRRLVMLGTTAITKLRLHSDRQYTLRLVANSRWDENDLIFPNSIGKPMDQRRLLGEYKKLLAKAGLPIIRFHDLRHTAATLMLLAGVHPKIVQETLGHSDINLTLNTYSHALPTLQREAAAKMDELMTLTELEPFKDSIRNAKKSLL